MVLGLSPPRSLRVRRQARSGLSLLTVALLFEGAGPAAFTSPKLPVLCHAPHAAPQASARSHRDVWCRAFGEWTDSTSVILAEQAPSIIIEVLEFLLSAVVTAPVAQALGVSPVLGYIFSGVVLGPSGLGIFANDESIEKLAFIGILFLLFEAGLELSSERLKKLTKYAFGLGTLQVVITSACVGAAVFFGAGALNTLATSFDLTTSVGRLDQVVVIAVSLALSAKAFVLQVLGDKKLAASTIGQASLGVLLLQDIALVPVLVLLPLIEDSSGKGLDGGALATYAGTAVGGLAAIAFVGGPLLGKLFDVVARSKKREVFVGLCILCVLGISQLTNALGLSTTLGALVGGVLLAESNFRTQVEADIAPFRGLLVGLFFFTLGARADPGLLLQEWQLSAVLLLGVSVAKIGVISAMGPLFDISLGQSVRLGFLLATGSGEASVIYTLASKYGVVDEPTLKLLTTIVVFSSALTPLFADIGDRVGAMFDKRSEDKGDTTTVFDAGQSLSSTDPAIALICGMGPLGQQVASFISNLDNASKGVQWIGLDLDPRRVQELRGLGLPVFYGDGSRMQVLTSAGIVSPPALIIVTSADPGEAEVSVERLRYSFPNVPILSHASSPEAYAKLLLAATDGKQVPQAVATGAELGSVVPGVTETAIRMGLTAMSQLATVPEDVKRDWAQHQRRETDRRLRSSTAASKEAETFFIGAAPGTDVSVWDAIVTRDGAVEETARSMRFLETVALLQDRVLSGSALASLAADIRGSSTDTPAELVRRSFRAGEVVFQEGEDGNEMFIVEEGTCAASMADEPDKVVAQYAVGDTLGEYAMILKQPRPVSVRAVTDTCLVVIDRPSFKRLTQGSGQLGRSDIPQ